MAKTVRKNSRRRSRQTHRKKKHRGGFSIKSLGKGIKRGARSAFYSAKHSKADREGIIKQFDDLGNNTCLKQILGEQKFNKYDGIIKYVKDKGKHPKSRKIKFMEGLENIETLNEEKKTELLEIFDKSSSVDNLKQILGDKYDEYLTLAKKEDDEGNAVSPASLLSDDIECKKAMFIKNLPKDTMEEISKSSSTTSSDAIDANVVDSEKKCNDDDCPSNAECIDDKSEEGYHCECKDGYKKTEINDQVICASKTSDDKCKEKYKHQIEDLEKEIKKETEKLEEHIKFTDNKKETETETKYQKVKTFIKETKENVKVHFKQSHIESKKKELRELLTQSAIECLKDEVTFSLAKKIESEEKIFEEFEKLEIQKLKEDFEPLFNKLKKDKDEIRDLTIFVISSDNGDIYKNEYTGIQNTNINPLKVKTKYKILKKAFIRLENGDKLGKKIYLSPGEIIETSSRKQHKTKGQMAQISSGKYNGRWIKFINQDEEPVIELIPEDEETLNRDISGRTDADYELKAGDVLIMPEPYLNSKGSMTAIQFQKMDPYYGDKYDVYLEGTKENPIYIKSQLGGGELKVFTNSYFMFSTYKNAINPEFDDSTLNRLPYKERVKYVISPEIRNLTIHDQIHIFKEDILQKITDFSYPFLNNISLSKVSSDERIILILQEFLLKIIETLRKANELELKSIGEGAEGSGGVVYKFAKVTGNRGGQNKSKTFYTYNEFGGGKTGTNEIYKDENIYIYVAPDSSDLEEPYINHRTPRNSYILTASGGWVKEEYIDQISKYPMNSDNRALEIIFKHTFDRINDLLRKKIEDRVLYNEDTNVEEKKKKNIYKLLGLNEEKSGLIKVTSKINDLFKSNDGGNPSLDKNELNEQFFYCGVIKNPVDIYALPPPCSGISKSNLSVIDDIIYYEQAGSVRDGKKLLNDGSKEPNIYTDYKYVNLECAPKLLVNSEGEEPIRKKNIIDKCGPPFDRIDGIRTMNEDGKEGFKRTCLNISKLSTDDDSYTNLKRNIEAQKKELITSLRGGYSMNSSEIKVIKRHILELDWISSLYDTIKNESDKQGQHITRIPASEETHYEVMGLYVDKYACLLNAYDSDNMDESMIDNFNCDNSDANFISELNRNEKLIQKFYSRERDTEKISEQKYKYFGLPKSKDSIYSRQYTGKDYGFIRNVRYRMVTKDGSASEWENLHDDMALSLTDIKLGISNGTNLKIMINDIQEWMKTTGGKILIAGAMMGLKKGFRMAITKVLKILVAGPIGLMMGGGGGKKRLTNDNKYYTKPPKIKRTKKRRKRKITKKTSHKR